MTGMMGYSARRLTHLWMAHEGLSRNPALVAHTIGRAVFADLVYVFTENHWQENFHRACMFREEVMRQYHELMNRRLLSVVQDFKIEITDKREMVITFNLLWRPHDHITYTVPLTPMSERARNEYLNLIDSDLVAIEGWLKARPQIILEALQ